MLGIPVPPLFMATNQTPDQKNQWEVVDGLQRLLTLVNFTGDLGARHAARLSDTPLKLTGLDKLTSLEGMSFNDLAEDIRTTLDDRPVKVIVLNDKSDLQVRFDLFERLNTGGVALTDQEVRECVFRGEFMDMLTTLAQDENFKRVVLLPAAKCKDGRAEDYLLRFFAFIDNYTRFNHSVKDFLNDFAGEAAKAPRIAERTRVFHRTFNYLARSFPDGLKTRLGTTPVNLFEGVSVGAALALSVNERLLVPNDTSWIQSKKMRDLTTGATNSRKRVVGRVELARDYFLGAS